MSILGKRGRPGLSKKYYPHQRARPHFHRTDKASETKVRRVTSEDLNLEELREMQRILSAHGYDIEHAARLQEEGMGPEELRGRIATGEGKMGSLEYTHRIHKVKKYR